MEQIALVLLNAFNLLLGIGDFPTTFSQQWQISKTWEKSASQYTLDASTTELSKECSKNPASYVLFPRIIHSAQEIYVDDKLVYEFGDPTFKKASPFYFQPLISCGIFKTGNRVRWVAHSYSKYFSRFTVSPHLTNRTNVNFYNVTGNTIAAGVIIILSIFSFLISFGRVQHSLAFSVSGGGLLLSLYFFNAANSDFNLLLPMLTSHKLADLGLWVGGSLFFYALFIDRVFSRSMYILLVTSTFIGSIMILVGSSGDEIQLGTMVPVIPFLLCSVIAFHRIISSGFQSGFNRNSVTRLVALSLFFLSGNNDLLNIFGLIETPMLLWIGIAGAVFGLSMAVSQEIEKTYKERDTLLASLEKKVQEKTQHLSEALLNLKDAQAELIQSARLASLGTLSAGVAHEINNSINYVNGALQPLEKKFLLKIPESDRPQALKLFQAIKEGTHLTVEIVKSLRTYTGLNQAPVNDINVRNIVTSVLTMLKSKLRTTKVDVNVDEHISFVGSMVGFNQILMNLITNALDANINDSPSLKITADSDGRFINLAVSDNGPGIPPEIQDRIFDPFFTTKEVGKGTGLGLHIIKKEVDRHGGTISFETSAKGTTFLVKLPIESALKAEEGAA